MKEDITSQQQAQKLAEQAGVGVKPTATELLVRELKREEEEKKAKQLAQKFRLPYEFLIDYPISPDVLYIIPREMAEKYRFIAFLRSGKKVKVALENPTDEKAKEALLRISQASGLSIIPVVASRSSISYGIKLYDLLAAGKAAEVEKISIEKEEITLPKAIANLAELQENISKVPITKLVDIIFLGAVGLEASDIHWEPEENQVKLRYRIDGVLHDIAVLPKDRQQPVTSRLKFLGKLKLDLVDLPQDGRFTVEVGGKSVDIRISTMPSIYGESIVMRLLLREAELRQFEDLGFVGSTADKMKLAMKAPHGLILLTGPTGSGKTTTLYAMLQKISTPERKVITLEDPIEYRLPGIIQTQVEQELGYTFAEGLRAIMRQNPDVILVGEIRDRETAETALHAAMTGHIVLSTLHTNNAPSAIPRLLDMGIEPFLLVGTMQLLVAQRLVRKICERCKEEYIPEETVLNEMKKIYESIPAAEREKIVPKFPDKFYRGKGCSVCNNSGYKGRTVIAEAFQITKEVEEAILQKAPVTELETIAKKQGMLTMEQDGVMKVLLGITTIEEVWRVVRS
jgi:type II secretory ATPase GspE/PulE/Tfp pilus assembly ATPase PilB-like protein